MSTRDWPSHVVDALGRTPQVGDWYAECCQADLFQIGEPGQLADLQERHAEGFAIGEFFATETAARAALSPECRSGDSA